jgi:hypothetical protein
VSPDRLLCPSTDAAAPGAVVLGVILGTAEEPRLHPLERPVPVDDTILASTAPLPPTQVLRLAAVCGQDACRHFGGGGCSLAAKVVRMLPEVADALPYCRIRNRCVWFAQEGAAACVRCPQVVTHAVDPPPAMARAADPLVPVPKQSPEKGPKHDLR